MLKGSNRATVLIVDARSVTADLTEATSLHCLDSERDFVVLWLRLSKNNLQELQLHI